MAGGPTQPDRDQDPRAPERRPLFGLNHNFGYRQQAFHIQTEDMGRETQQIVTHIFHDGRVIASARTTYADADDPAEEIEQVRLLMQEQHKALLRGLKRGEFDADIGGLLQPGAVEPATPTPPQTVPRWHNRLGALLSAWSVPLAVGAALLVAVSAPMWLDLQDDATQDLPAVRPSATAAQAPVAEKVSAPNTDRATHKPDPTSRLAPWAPTASTPVEPPRVASTRDQIREHLTAALQARKRRRWQAAQTAAAAVLSLQAEHRLARRIDRQARKKIRQRRTVRRYLSLARRALRHKRWEQAQTRAEAVLKLQPRNRKATAIKRYAEQKLRDRRTAAEQRS